MKLILQNKEYKEFYEQESIVKSVIREDVKQAINETGRRLRNKINSIVDATLDEQKLINEAYAIFKQKKPKNAQEAEKISVDAVEQAVNKRIKNSIIGRI